MKLFLHFGCMVLCMAACLGFANCASAQSCDEITVNMTDSYGDGWNSGTMTITDGWGSTVFSQTLSSGFEGSGTFSAVPGWYYLVVTSGSFPSEIGWTLSNLSNQLLAGGAPNQQWFYVPEQSGGCTNSYACNYDPTAVCDNGSCCYTGCVWIELYDGNEDGWNGGYVEILDNQGTVVFQSYGPPDGWAQSYDYVCLDWQKCYTVRMFAQEYWLYDDNTAVIYTSMPGGQEQEFATWVDNDSNIWETFSPWGGCTDGCTDQTACNFNSLAAYQSETCCTDQCVMMIMYDSYGDGWNLGEASIINWRGEVVHTTALPHMNFGTDKMCLPAGCYTIEVSGGYYPAEIAWELGNAYSNYSWSTGIINGGVGSYAFQVGTVVEGCTDAASANYNPEATCNNGTCSGFCQADLDGNGTVNVADLLIFMSAFGGAC